MKKIANKSADSRQFEEYKNVLGAKNLPNSLDEFQKLKYNDGEGWESLKKLAHTTSYMQNKLDYVMPNGEKAFIPQNATINNCKTIAGKGSNTEIRVVQGLVDRYGGKAEDWKKRVGKIESDKFNFDVHWYELNGKQYRMKLKNRSDKK